MKGICRFKTLLVAALCASIAHLLGAAEKDEFRDEIRPVLEKNCFECHGPEKHKGDLNLASFEDYEQVTKDKETWQKVLEQVQAFEMPPKGKREMSFGDHGKLLRWLRRLPKPEGADCDKIASDRTANFYRGYVMSRRLNRAEYANTIRDLFGVKIDVEELLPDDGGGGEGFDTSGNALFTSSIHIEKYLAAAERVLDTVLLSERKKGEEGGAAAPPYRAEMAKAREQILIAQPSRKVPARQAAEKTVSAFARKAFRRPVSKDEVDRLLTMFDRASARGDGFVPSVKLALKAVLVSPHFLFLAEPEPEQPGVQKLGAVPLASKLSYFLWSSMPDEELLSLAESGKLLDEDTYRHQIARMLADPKAERWASASRCSGWTWIG